MKRKRFKLTYKNGEFVVVAPEGSYFIIGSLGGYPKRVEGGRPIVIRYEDDVELHIPVIAYDYRKRREILHPAAKALLKVLQTDRKYAYIENPRVEGTTASCDIRLPAKCLSEMLKVAASFFPEEAEEMNLLKGGEDDEYEYE